MHFNWFLNWIQGKKPPMPKWLWRKILNGKKFHRNWRADMLLSIDWLIVWGFTPYRQYSSHVTAASKHEDNAELKCLWKNMKSKSRSAIAKKRWERMKTGGCVKDAECVDKHQQGWVNNWYLYQWIWWWCRTSWWYQPFYVEKAHFYKEQLNYIKSNL